MHDITASAPDPAAGGQALVVRCRVLVDADAILGDESTGESGTEINDGADDALPDDGSDDGGESGGGAEGLVEEAGSDGAPGGGDEDPIDDHERDRGGGDAGRGGGDDLLITRCPDGADPTPVTPCVSVAPPAPKVGDPVTFQLRLAEAATNFSVDLSCRQPRNLDRAGSDGRVGRERPP